MSRRIEKDLFPKPIFRLLSGAFDFVGGAIIIMIIYMVLSYYFKINYNPTLLFAVFYYIGIPYLTNGQTLGQFIFRLKTVSLLSEKLSFIQITVRSITSLLGVNYLFEVLGIQKLTNENNQLFYDRLFYTTVIKQNKYDDFKLLEIKEKITRRFKIVSAIICALIVYIMVFDIIELIK